MNEREIITHLENADEADMMEFDSEQCIEALKEGERHRECLKAFLTSLGVYDDIEDMMKNDAGVFNGYGRLLSVHIDKKW